MNNEFTIYPCNKNGKILKGFCPTITDGQGVLSTVAGWKKFAKQFKIRYYAFKSNDVETFTICKLTNSVPVNS